jgi:hypothetical protein
MGRTARRSPARTIQNLPRGSRNSRPSWDRQTRPPARVRTPGARRLVPEPIPSSRLCKPSGHSGRARIPKARHRPRSSPTAQPRSSDHTDKEPSLAPRNSEPTLARRAELRAIRHYHRGLHSPRFRELRSARRGKYPHACRALHTSCQSRHRAALRPRCESLRFHR